MKLKMLNMLNSMRRGKNESDNFSPEVQRPSSEEESNKEMVVEESDPKQMRKGSGSSFLKLTFSKNRSASFEQHSVSMSARGPRNSTPMPIVVSKSTSYSSLTYPVTDDTVGTTPTKNYPGLNSIQPPSIPSNLLDLLNNEIESEKFFQYLQSKYCPESYHFWRAVQSYKVSADPTFVRGSLPAPAISSTTSTIVFTRSRGNSIKSGKLNANNSANNGDKGIDTSFAQSTPQTSPLSISISASVSTSSPLANQVNSPLDPDNPIYKNALEIYQEFISPDARYEINISHTTKQNIQSALIDKTIPLHLPTVFDRALHQVYLLMLYSSFHNYCNSIMEKHNSPPGREMKHSSPPLLQSISSTV